MNKYPHLLYLLIILLFFTHCSTPKQEVLFKGGEVYDGSGGFEYHLDIEIQDSTIHAMGKVPKDKTQKVIEINNRKVAPIVLETIAATQSMRPKEIASRFMIELIKRAQKDTIPLGKHIKELSKVSLENSRWKGFISKAYLANFIVFDPRVFNSIAPLEETSSLLDYVDYIVLKGKVYPISD